MNVLERFKEKKKKFERWKSKRRTNRIKNYELEKEELEKKYDVEKLKTNIAKTKGKRKSVFRGVAKKIGNKKADRPYWLNKKADRPYWLK